ncbi:MAG TPA: putative glycoside hydrolase [Candidatus Eremiobacteraceae bacterium]|nr:putative glycoside hydrolase [Candidatus Eremiobacteraceae bacterium]
MRRSSVLTIAAVSCFLCAAAAIRIIPQLSSAQAAQPQNAQPLPAVTASQGPQLKPASATVPASLQPADISSSSLRLYLPGATTEIYTAKRGESIPAVAHQYLHRTAYLTSSELSEAIRAANGKSNSSNILKAGEQITIPGILPAPIVEHTVPIARDFEVRAIYLTGVMAASDHGLRIIRHWREVGGNAVVFDIKDSDGSVNIPFEHPLLGKHQVYIHDLPKFVHFVHSQNMHAIARIAIFRDERMVVEHPELAVQSKKHHQPWRENGKLVWTDPSQPKVQEYDIALAKFVAQSGADEIQFDYVRFPAEGDQKDASFVYQAEHPESESEEATSGDKPCGDGRPSAGSGQALGRPAKAKQGGSSTKAAPCKTAAQHTFQRPDVITAFLKKAYAELHPTGVLLSLDVFGVMAWQRPVDLSHTGQDIVGMAKYCDVLSPMIYPSHFFGMDNIAHPGDAPEHFIGESMQRFELITKGSGVVIRPWLQAFRWRTKTYSPEYIKVQVATAKEKGGIGFLLWNAANDYGKPYEAMPEMKAANTKEKDKFFRGDELPTATVKASLTPAAAPAPPETASH